MVRMSQRIHVQSELQGALVTAEIIPFRSPRCDGGLSALNWMSDLLLKMGSKSFT